MILALFLLFFSPPGREELIPDTVYTVPARGWGQIEPIRLMQRTAMLDATFQVESGSDNVRMALLRQFDFERLRDGDPHGMLAVTDPGSSGRLQYQIRQRGAYVMVLNNRGDHPEDVRVHVWLDFAAPRSPAVSEISPERRLAVVLISCAVFFSMVTFSLRRIMRAVKAKTAN